jgi:hypothetical protein
MKIVRDSKNKIKPNQKSDSTEKMDKSNPVLEDNTHNIMTMLKKVLGTTWGLRIGAVILSIIVFYIGYFIGGFGESHLKSRIEDAQEDIKELKVKISEKKNYIIKLKKEKFQLKILYAESEQKRRFFHQRDKIRKPLLDAKRYWSEGKRKETVEELYKALINLQIEAKNSLGISRWLYKSVKKRLNLTIDLINKNCNVKSSLFESIRLENKDNECVKKIGKFISTSIKSLPSPK